MDGLHQRIVKWLVCFVAGALLSPVIAFAQSISLTSPMSPLEIAEGDEFFTDVVKDRMDFDKRRDFLWEEFFLETSINATGGTWTGQFDEAGAYVFPLFPGFGDDPGTEAIESAYNIGRTGSNFPIDSSKYSLVTFRETVSSRYLRALYWSREVYWPDGTLSAAALDGFYSNSLLNGFADATPMVYSYDLSSFSNWTTAPVYGLRIDPSVTGPAGTSVSYDWVRVSDPASTDNINVSWSTADLPTPTGGWPPRVSIYVDSDNTGFDGDLVAAWETQNVEGDPGNGRFSRPVAADGSVAIPAAGFPPGDYYFYVEIWTNYEADAFIARSGYSAKVTIEAKPEVTVSAPSRTSGLDYAAAVVGNPWDMESSTDIINLDLPMFQRNFQNAAFSNGVFSAQAIIPDDAPVDQMESDVQLWFNIDTLQPVDTSKYRYLTYTLELDESGYGNISDKVGNTGGWVARIVWWNDAINTDGAVTDDIVVYEGVNAYTLDLFDPNVLEPDESFTARFLWTDNSTLDYLRLDPAEVNQPTNFSLYDVLLTANPALTSDGLYEVEFAVADADSSSVSVSIYADDNDSGADGSLIWGPQDFSPGAHSVRLTQAELNQGTDTYLYLSVNDGSHTVVTYGDAPISFDYTQGGSTTSPDTPVITGITEVNGQLLVSIVSGSVDDIVTTYTVTCSSTGGDLIATGTVSPVTVTGIEAGAGYSCTATATNGSGTSAASASVEIETEADANGLPIWLLYEASQ